MEKTVLFCDMCKNEIQFPQGGNALIEYGDTHHRFDDHGYSRDVCLECLNTLAVAESLGLITVTGRPTMGMSHGEEPE